MKTRSNNPFFRFQFHASHAVLALAAIVFTQSTQAAGPYYWDNVVGAGFGTAGGTWSATTAGPTPGWTTDATGAAVPASVTTATADAINFGTGTAGQGLAAGTVTVGTVSAGNITFGSQSGAIVLSTGTITTAAAETITVNNTTDTINSILTGATTSLTKAGTGILILSGANTYTGTTFVTTGTLSIAAGGIAAASPINVSAGAIITTALYNGYGGAGPGNGAWTIAGTMTVTGGASAEALPASVTLNNGTMSGASFATFGTYFINPSQTATVTANGATNTISGGNIGMALSSVLALSTPLVTDAITVSSALGATSALTGAVSKTGLGTATLSSASTYTGGTTLTAGTVIVKNATALGTVASALKLNGGTLDLQTGGTAYLTTVGGTTTIQSDNAASGAGTTKTLGTLSIGAFTLNVAPGANATGSTAGITFGATTISGTSSAAVFSPALNSTLTLGTVTGTTPTITMSGTGSLVLSGTILTATALTISNGSVTMSTNNSTTQAALTVNSPGILNFNNGQIFGVLNGTGTINESTNQLYTNSAASGSYSGTINGTGSYVKQSTGIQTLSGLSTFTGSAGGAILLQGGTLIVNSLNFVTSGTYANHLVGSALGMPGTATAGTISIGSTTTAAQLTYNGTGEITDRVINLAGTTGGATLDQSGASGTLEFTSSFTAVGAGIKTLTLQGSTAGLGKIGNAIVDSTSATSLSKAGTGTWTLAGTNTFTGVTSLSGGGTLKLDYSTNDTTKLADGAALTLGGGTVELAGGTHTEVVASTTLTAATANTITRTSGSATLALKAITAGAGATLSLTGNNLATTDTLNTNGILGFWATVTTGGLTTWATNSTNAAGGAIIAAPFSDVNRLGGIVLNNAASQARIIDGGVSGNITLNTAPQTQVNTLRMSATGGPATIAPTATTDIFMIGSDAGTFITLDSAAGSLTIGASANNGVLTTGGTANTTPATIGFVNNSASNSLVVNSTIANNGTDVVSLSNTGVGKLVLGGANTFTGTITVSAGSLLIGNPSALSSANNVTLSGTSTFDLFGNSVTVGSFTNVATNFITNTGTGTGTDTLTINTTGPTVAALITDGPTRKTALRVNNALGANQITTNTANTYSGGLILANSATGTRIAAGTITGSPWGTGPITVGEAATDKAGIYFSVANQTLANPVVSNTGLGTDRVGTFRVDGTGTIFSGQLTANLAPMTFSTNGTGAVNVTGKITGPNGLTLVSNPLGGSALTVTLSNASNDYAGDTIINQNPLSAKIFTLTLGGANRIPNGVGKGNVMISTNGSGVGTLNLAGFSETINGLSGNGTVTSASGTPALTLGDNNQTSSFSGLITGTLTLSKIGSGTQTLSGANTYAGGTTLNAGSINFTSTGVGTAGTITFAGNSTLQWGSATTTDLSGRIAISNGITAILDTGSNNLLFASSFGASGSGALTKTGSGTLTFSATNTYTGGTVVSAGTLLLSGTVNMPAAGTLQVNNGANFSLADGAVSATTTTAGLTLATGSSLTFDWVGGATDTLTSAAAVTATGNVGININPLSSPSGSGLTLISAPSGLNGATYFLANNFNYSATLTQTDTAVKIGSYTTVSPLSAAYWLGGQVTGALGAMALSSGTSNWASDAAGTSAGGLVPGSTSDVFFSTTTGATQQANVVLGNNMTLNSVTFNDTTPVTIGIDGFSLTLNSSGTGSASAISANQNATINAPVFIGASQTWTVASATTLSIGGTVFSASAFGLTMAGSGGLSESSTGVISGALSLTHSSSGTSTLTGANTYTGATNVMAGSLVLSGGNNRLVSGASVVIGAPATIGKLVLGDTSAASDQTLGSLTASGLGGNVVGAHASTDSVLTLSSDSNVTFAGILGGAGTNENKLALTKSGAGIFTLTGINSYTGLTTISTGTLQLGDGTIGNDGTIIASSGITNNGTLIYNRFGTLSSSVPISGTGTVTKTGSGTQTLAGNNTYAGITTVNAGTLILSGNNSATTGATNISGGTLVAANVSALNTTALVAISTTTASGTLRLATDTSVNPFLITASTSNPGTIISDRATTGSGITHFLGATTLGANIYTFQAGGNVTSGTAAVSLASVNLAAGSAGTSTLNPTTANVLIPGAVTIGSSNFAKTLALDGTNTGNTISGAISNGLNTVSLTKSNASTWTLSGNNSYTGTTTVSGGTLVAASSASSTTGAIIVGNTAANAVLNVTGTMTGSTINAGTAASSFGALNVTGGTLTMATPETTDTISFGSGEGGYGAFTMTSGAFTQQRFMFGGIGTSVTGGTGVGLITGGTVNSAGWFIISRAGASTGVVTITGGTINHASASQDLVVGLGGTGRAELNVAGGLINNTGRRVTFAAGTAGGFHWSGTGIVNLNAGTLLTNSFNYDTLTSPFSPNASSYINFSGGTLKAASASTTFLPAYTPSGTGVNGVFVNGAFGSFTGGAVIDTNGFNNTIGANLLAPTGNGVTSLSINNAGSGYIGAPSVMILDGGVPSTATAYAVVGTDSTNLSTFGKITSVVITNPGVIAGAATVNLVGGGGTGAAISVASTGANTSGGLTKQGVGTLALSGGNTYTGTTTINGGTLQLGSATTTGTLALASAIVTNSTFAVNRTNATTQGTDFSASAITGTGGFTQAGTGTTTLNVANTYSGITAVTAGVLQISASNQIGDASATNSITLGAGTLSSTAGTYDLGVTRAITLSGAGSVRADAGTLTLSGTVTNGANSLALLGAGNVIVSGVIGSGATPTGGLTIGSSTVDAHVTLSGNNLFTGNVVLPASNVQPFAVLTLTNSGALGVGPKTVQSAGGGEIHLQNNITFASNISFATSGSSQQNSVSTGRPVIVSDSGNNTINGNISMTSGNGSTIIASDSGLLTLNGNLTATAVTRQLQVRGDGNGIISGIISNGSTVNLPVLKDLGTGTWTFTGVNTYSGATTVSAGTLRVNSPGSLAAGSAVAVNGTSTLGGNGTINGSVTLAAAANLSPGAAAAVGTLAIGGGLDISAQAAGTGKLVFDLDTTAASDKVAVTGAAAIGTGVLGFSDFTFSNVGGLAAGTYKLITTTTGFFTSTLDTGNLTGTIGSFNGALQITGNDLELVVTSANGYDAWATAKGLTGAPGSSTDPAKSADPDGDGTNNLAEFAFNGNPLSGSDNGLRALLLQDTTGPTTNELTYIVAVRDGVTFTTSGLNQTNTTAVDGLFYTVQGSLDLAFPGSQVSHVGAASNTAPAATGLPNLTGTDWEYHTFRLDASEGLTDKGFLRAKVSE